MRVLFVLLFSSLLHGQILNPIVNGGVPQLPKTNLLVYYDFVQGANPLTLYDKSGNGHNGTLASSPYTPVWATGGGLQMAGSHGVAVPTISASTRTIIALINPSAVHVAATFQVYAWFNNSLFNAINDRSWTTYDNFGSGNVSLLSAKMDPNPHANFLADVHASNRFELWQGLTLEKWGTVSGSPANNYITVIGDNGAGSYPMSGTIHALAVYSGGLTTAQLQQCYRAFKALAISRGFSIYNTSSRDDAFGDSVTLGTGASVPANNYVNLIGSGLVWDVFDHGLGGYRMADIVGIELMGVTQFNGAAMMDGAANSTMLVGYNDMRVNNTDATAQSAFTHELNAAIAYAGTRAENKVTGQGTGVTYSGTWTNSTLESGSLGKYSSTNGDTASFSLTGTTIFVGTSKTAANASAQFSVTVDGVTSGPYSPAPYVAGASVTYNPTVVAITGLSNTSHSVVFTVVDGTGKVYFDWAGAITAGVYGPNVFVGNCLPMNATGYAGGGSATAVGQYNSIIASAVSTMAGYGIRAKLVDVSSGFNTATMVSGDNVHPNDTGHAFIANQYLAAIQPVIQ
jgi:hypothetical protein